MKCPECGKKWGWGADRMDKTEWLEGHCPDCFRKEYPGFPREVLTGVASGVGIRDYFAAAALSGMRRSVKSGLASYEDLARWAYDMADAMLAARKGPYEGGK